MAGKNIDEIAELFDEWKLKKGLERERKEKIPESLCWDCMRSTWACLCSWPRRKPPGAKIVKFKDKETGEQLRRVVSCPLYWPDNQE